MATRQCLSLRPRCTFAVDGEACADCRTYGATVAGGGDAPSLPDGLRRRLLAIPRQRPEVDGEELYRAALDRSAGRTETDPAAELRADQAAVYDALVAAFEDARLPTRLPAPLRRRLRSLATPPSLSPWLADSRYAAAVCLLLTAFSGLWVGDVAARVERTQQTVRATSSEWVALGEAKGQEWSGRVSRDVDSRLTATRRQASAWIDQGRQRWRQGKEELDRRWKQSRLAELLAGYETQQGDDHER